MTDIKNSCTCKVNKNHTKDGILHNGSYRLNNRAEKHYIFCKKCKGVLRPPFSL